MEQYVKKPIPVRAKLFQPGDETGIYDGKPYIQTLENPQHFGDFGDNYIVFGNHDDKWLVRKDIFEATYELYAQPEIAETNS